MRFRSGLRVVVIFNARAFGLSSSNSSSDLAELLAKLIVILKITRRQAETNAGDAILCSRGPDGVAGLFYVRHDFFGEPMHLLKKLFLRVHGNRHRRAMVDTHRLELMNLLDD